MREMSKEEFTREEIEEAKQIVLAGRFAAGRIRTCGQTLGGKGNPGDGDGAIFGRHARGRSHPARA